MTDDVALRGAAVLLWLTGAGFGIPRLWRIWYLHSTGRVATVMGFPAYGHGPFEGHGLSTTIPLLLAYLVVCVLEVVAGVRIWGGARDGAICRSCSCPSKPCSGGASRCRFH